MTGDKKGKGVDNASKKDRVSFRQPGGIVIREPCGVGIRDRSPSPYLPPHGGPLLYHSSLNGQSYSYSHPAQLCYPRPYICQLQGYTEPAFPNYTTMIPTPDFTTPHGISQLPPGFQRSSLSGTPTTTPSSTISHSSSSSTLQFRISGLQVGDNNSESGTLTTDGSSRRRLSTLQIESYDEYGRLIIEPVGFRKSVSGYCNMRPRWILQDNLEKLLHYWTTNARFKQLSRIGKKAIASIKGGSLHTSGAKSQVAVRRKLPAHTQLTQEQMDQEWLDTIGGPTRIGTTYGMANQVFCRFRSALQGIEQKISELSSSLQAAEARDTQFAGVKAQ
ncbi:hypothetical protein RND71_001763 [Anisodus tanguticus]|uniref:Uncharacterized protein n=1 Tax=Anisodus tanguticus TaxID=243964 RepID=A0AAE1VW32_9SOLA|nr:hypothetical protein RND71_001763 [Anisodus tanguticus]